jgi:hypothetical protein
MFAHLAILQETEMRSDETPMSDSSQKFDLTTAEGHKIAFAITQVLFPVPYWIGKALFDGIASLT